MADIADQDLIVPHLARVAWDRVNTFCEIPAGIGLDWETMDDDVRLGEMEAVRAVIDELGKLGMLREPMDA